MSDTAVRCPHCGEVYPGRDLRDATSSSAGRPKPLEDVTAAEAAALLAVAGADARPRSFWRGFLTPDARLSSPLWVLDAIFVVATLPLAAGVIFTLLVRPRRHRRRRRATYTGNRWENLAIGALGGAVVLAYSYFYDWFSIAVVAVIIAWVALAGRAVLRNSVEREATW
ncbi:MAG: hypothetical protein DRJ42_19050 [Deltaproteobacteria bacterium]|nr:MAG: hypothetical protein DRJ42_19050 [Deltaproteobacteria bacterium]